MAQLGERAGLYMQTAAEKSKPRGLVLSHASTTTK